MTTNHGRLLKTKLPTFLIGKLPNGKIVHPPHTHTHTRAHARASERAHTRTHTHTRRENNFQACRPKSDSVAGEHSSQEAIGNKLTVNASFLCGQRVLSRMSLESHLGLADRGGAICRPDAKSRSAGPKWRP